MQFMFTSRKHRDNVILFKCPLTALAECFLAALHGLQDLSSPTRDWNPSHSSERKLKILTSREPGNSLAQSFLCGTFYRSVKLLLSACREIRATKIPCPSLWLLNEIDLKENSVWLDDLNCVCPGPSLFP